MNKKFLRLLSVPVAIVLLLSSFGVSFCVSGANTDTTNFSASQEDDWLKEFGDLNSFVCNNSGEVIDDFENSSMVSVPADYWFVKLGGNQQDIDNYQRNNDAVDTNDIGMDVLRCEAHFSPIAQNVNFETLKKVFYNMLQKYYTKHKEIEYTQGWDGILYMIYYKFMRTRGTTEVLGAEDEAKVYFIYTKFMEMIWWAFNVVPKWQSQAKIYANDFLNSGVEIFSKCYNNLTEGYFSDSNRLTLFQQGIVTAGVYLLGIEPAIKIWDYIIMCDGYVINDDHLGRRFARKRTLSAANALICSYVNLHSDDFFIKDDEASSLVLKDVFAQSAIKAY